MWSVWLSVITTLAILLITRWVRRWRNPKCNGKLPPGSMGLPLIGETIEFLRSSKSIDMPAFIKKRMARYGPLFKTSLVGHPVVISSDPEINYFILSQGEKLVEAWYMDSFAQLLNQDKTREVTSTGAVQKYLRNIVLKHFGTESIKQKHLPQLEEMISKRLHVWSTVPSVEVKRATSSMISDFTAKRFISYDADITGESIGDAFNNFIQGFMSIPLNIPGTVFHECLKNQKKLVSRIRNEIEERKANPEIRKDDFLEHISDDLGKEEFLTEDLIVYATCAFLFASFETISSTLTVAMTFLTEHPSVVQQLVEEHEEILKNRENVDSGLTWEEYKSMNFTHHVITESLRLSSIAPGILRRTVRDIPINGYTIPEGWMLMVVPAAIHLNPANYDDPLAFNPWRWKDMGETTVAKKFIPFGGGMKLCAGAEFSRVLMAIFIHKLVTKYSWTKLKGGEVTRTPALVFGDGFHIKVSKKA